MIQLRVGMVQYPTRDETLKRPSSVAALPETQSETLDLVKFLQAERLKDLEMREQSLTIELNEVRRQLGKAPISQRKLQELLERKCLNCGEPIK